MSLDIQFTNRATNQWYSVLPVANVFLIALVDGLLVSPSHVSHPDFLLCSNNKKHGMMWLASSLLSQLCDHCHGHIVCKLIHFYLHAPFWCTEILELVGNAARDNKESRIVPRHITLAVKNDEELNKLLGGVTIASGGVLPNIHAVLLPKKSSVDDAMFSFKHSI